eukprot:CAMPEP_0185797648 /NCGR_PEP_ID=MMETSP1174-20130828/161730_1 /TAXON_ID=35687 /ORGANISM="Dictyocha speculum, Strain CCMP1381" /LENGTH=40 /DNA_ID= /DNA_START= /DNA_END= /DNA_ORIENTATION=
MVIRTALSMEGSYPPATSVPRPTATPASSRLRTGNTASAK